MNIGYVEHYIEVDCECEVYDFRLKLEVTT